MSCEHCIRESQIVFRFTRPPLQNHDEYITAPEDATKLDLMPQLPPSCGYDIILTDLDVFSCSLFANPTSNQNVKTLAKVIINIITKHRYLQVTLISDLGVLSY